MLRKLWRTFFVAIVLFPLSLLVGVLGAAANPDCFTCGSRIAMTFWFIGILAHQPIAWSNNSLSFSRRLGVWVTATIVAFVCYASIEALALGLFASGAGWRAVQVAQAANVIGMIVALVVSMFAVKRLSRKNRVPSVPQRMH